MSLSEIAKLRQENEELREQVRWFEGLFNPPVQIVLNGSALPPKQAIILQLLVSREFVTHNALDFALFQEEDRSSNIAAVYLCKLRARLRPLGIEIKNVWSKGFSLSREDRARLSVLIADQRAARAA